MLAQLSLHEERSKEVIKLIKPKKIIIPKHIPSVVIPPRSIVYTTADKTTCAECVCYPIEDKYEKRKKLNACQKSPLTLYELAENAVDCLYFPYAMYWDVDDVANWMDQVVGFPEYKSCIYDNHINGKRLLRLEDPSHLPPINIRNFEHIKKITAAVRKEFKTEYVWFSRSIGFPPRKPLTHCTWFKSRTGYDYGIRQNWTRCDILRWMKIILPRPLHLDHWDLVWYQKPDFPKTMIGNIPEREPSEAIPIWKEIEEYNNEYLVRRKFILLRNIPDEENYIWMEHRPGSPNYIGAPVETKKQIKPKKKARESLYGRKITLEGKKGVELILARRLMPKKKF